MAWVQIEYLKWFQQRALEVSSWSEQEIKINNELNKHVNHESRPVLSKDVTLNDCERASLGHWGDFLIISRVCFYLSGNSIGLIVVTVFVWLLLFVWAVNISSLFLFMCNVWFIHLFIHPFILLRLVLVMLAAFSEPPSLTWMLLLLSFGLYLLHHWSMFSALQPACMFFSVTYFKYTKGL